MLNIQKDKEAILEKFPQFESFYHDIEKAPSCKSCLRRKHERMLVKALREELSKPENAELRSAFMSGNISMAKFTPESVDRESCMFCFEKHMAKALVLLKEVEAGYTPDKGYPHLWLALGNLSEAEDEIIKEDKEMAQRVRQLRRKITMEISIATDD